MQKKIVVGNTVDVHALIFPFNSVHTSRSGMRIWTYYVNTTGRVQPETQTHTTDRKKKYKTE